MKTTLCPSCGSDKLDTTIRNKSLPIVYGKPAEWTEIVEHCSVCDESGDFSGQNDSKIESAVDTAKKQSVKYILDALSEMGITMAYLERALELSPRTIARWKTGKSSASSIALLRIVRTYPWIIDVADACYDHQFAQKKVLESASQMLHKALSNLAENDSASIFISQDDKATTIGFYARLGSTIQYNIPTPTQNILPVIPQVMAYPEMQNIGNVYTPNIPLLDAFVSSQLAIV